MTSGPLRLTLEQGLSAQMVDRLRESVRTMAAGQGLGQGVGPALELVVEELCTNVMEHSGAGWLELELTPERGGVRVRIRDNGRPFDVRGALPGRTGLNLELVEDRRLGLYMVEQLTSTLRSGRGADGVNQVEFEIHPGPDAAP